MSLEVRAASGDARACIEQMLDDYLGELSRYREIAVGATRAAEYPYLASYWAEPDRFPFTIWRDDRLAGFALCRRTEEGLTQLAEFFVTPEQRRRGTGTMAAAALFDRFPGRWELQVMARNEAATRFWRTNQARDLGNRGGSRRPPPT